MESITANQEVMIRAIEKLEQCIAVQDFVLLGIVGINETGYASFDGDSLRGFCEIGYRIIRDLEAVRDSIGKAAYPEDKTTQEGGSHASGKAAQC